METFESLRDQVSKITIYDIKSMYNQVRLTPNIRPIASAHSLHGFTQAKNMVLNVSEMEAKVQEATNDEPW